MPQVHLSDMPYEATQLADLLVQGDPIHGWKGDPRLELYVGVKAAPKTRYEPRLNRYVHEGEAVARRYEVWRHNEDGTYTRIVSRALTALHEIIPALVAMDPRTPGHEDTMKTVEKWNRKVDKEKADAIGEAHGEMVEHLWKLTSDRQNGPSTFRSMPGRNPDRQM